MIERLKPFRRPWLWFALWCLAIAIVAAVSLGPPPPLPELPSGTDKIEHALAYALLAFGAVQIFDSRSTCAVAGVALVIIGIGIEFAQGAFTVDRLRDPFDAIANAIGVLIGLASRATPARDWLLRFERRAWR